uniref:Uncharacterized protein n=1 Tax=Anabas testudineus TaxID=64144 RepID=A0AAQ6IJ76_ANATE
TFQHRGEYRALQRHRGGAEPNPTAHCPGSPESPPMSGWGSGEQERQHHTSSEEAGSSLQEEEDDPRGLTTRQTVRKTTLS